MIQKSTQEYKRHFLTALFLATSFCCSNVQAQSSTVTGRVTDSHRSVIPGVHLKIKGTSQGTVTDVDGGYSLEVPDANSVIVFSFIGYISKEVIVGSQTEINVELMDEIKSLSEVVVTALGINKESRRIGYAVATISGDQMNKARESNVALSLQGTVAGLNVKGTSGGPGGTANILLRGLPSMNSGGAPLFVINGIPMDNTQRGGAGEWGGSDNGDGIGNINPDDIESMTVLKGQAASALYGARASNGVILITTKTGKKKDSMIEYNTNYTMDNAMNNTDFQYEYGQGVYGSKPTTVALAQQSTRFSWGSKLDGSQVIQYDGKMYPYLAQRDNIKRFYRLGSNFTNTISVSRGGEFGAVRLSVSSLDNNSIVPNSGVKRKTFNLNVNQQITKKLSVTVLADYIDERSKLRPYLSDGSLNPNNGLFLATNIDERILDPGYDPTTGNEIRFTDDEYVTNPYFVINQHINDLVRKRLISSLLTRYDFTDWLYAQVRLGYDNIHDNVFTVMPWGTAFSTGLTGQLEELSQADRTEMNIEGIAGVNKKIGTDFTLDALIGGNIRKNNFEKEFLGGGPFVLPYVYSINNVTNKTLISTNYERKRVNSGFYSIDIGYKGTIMLNTTGRYDNYSTLYSINNPNKKTGIFTPSASVSFVFTELWKFTPLNLGKIRVSIAQTSGELTSPYQTSLYYSLGNSLNGKPYGKFGGTAPNSFLNPFTVTEVEVGTDLKFFENRLNFDIAWYNRKTSNEIMSSSYSQTTGFSGGYLGTGSTENKGLELQIKGTPVQRNSFSWDATFNFSMVNNKVLSTDPDNANVSLGQNRPTIGSALTAYVVGYAGPQILAYDYKRINGQIVVDDSGLPVKGDLIKMGSVIPKYYGGFLNQFNYKKVNLSFLIDYNFGNKVLSATEFYSIFRGLNKLTLEGRDGITTGVTESGAANTRQAQAQDYYQAVASSITSSSVVSGDFIKLRQVTLGYQIPLDKLGKFPFQSIQISFVARNLAILMRKAKNIDPEASFGSSVSYYGIEGTSLPSTRSYGVNINFKFK